MLPGSRSEQEPQVTGAMPSSLSSAGVPMGSLDTSRPVLPGLMRLMSPLVQKSRATAPGSPAMRLDRRQLVAHGTSVVDDRGSEVGVADDLHGLLELLLLDADALVPRDSERFL